MINKPYKPPFKRGTGPIARPRIENGNGSNVEIIVLDDSDVFPQGSARKDDARNGERYSKRMKFHAMGNSSTVKESVMSTDKGANNVVGGGTYYSVLWRKFSTKKHKTWDGDGTLAIQDGFATVYDDEGRICGRIACDQISTNGSVMTIGNREVEIDCEIPPEQFLRGQQFLGTLKNVSKGNPDEVGDDVGRQVIHDISKASSKFKKPSQTAGMYKPENKLGEPVPRYSADSPNAIVMKRPSSVPKGRQLVDVVVDPYIGLHLREHQREGVKFLYECVMGLRGFVGEGAILADEMGLGKTLQTIALLWTLLKQNPVYGAGPIVKKALIVCPVTLIDNWRKEFNKWLGKERIGVMTADDRGKNGGCGSAKTFMYSKAYSVLIVGYEKVRTICEDLCQGDGIDIVIADEGHRLKTAQNKSAAAMKSLNTNRRIILSGTPIQNDLGEFYTMADFVNPGLLGKYSRFKREFEQVIVRSQQPECTRAETEKGKARGEELAELMSQFVLRRTADILTQWLPPQTEQVLLCKATKRQADVYRRIVSMGYFSGWGNNENALILINVLKKASSAPCLLAMDTVDGEADGKSGKCFKLNPVIRDIVDSIPRDLLSQRGSSSKLLVLDGLLHHIFTETEERVVVVSNWTSTLELVEKMLLSMGYNFLRLDGTTARNKRQELVDRFNNGDQKNCFVFLLSAKAGGVGLNLWGASRLVLFDIDWNPSTDLQAMARIHRDGQKRACYVYRLITMGTVEEKIFQRQVMKRGLSDSVVDKKNSTSGFSREELRDLFTFDESDECGTHVAIGCKCDGRGNVDNFGVEDESELENGTNSGNDDVDSDSELPDLPELIRASQIKQVERQQSRASATTALYVERQKKSCARRSCHDSDGDMTDDSSDKPSEERETNRVQSLMKYIHYDTRRVADISNVPGINDLFTDSILKKLLCDKNSPVRFVFAQGNPEKELVKSYRDRVANSFY